METQPVNHLIAVLKSLAASTGVGSGIVTAINEYVPSAHDQALQKAAELLSNRLTALEGRLNEDYVRTEQFADLFKNCYFIVQRTQHEEKLRAASNILTNALLSDADEDKLPYDELDHFTRCIESLSIGAIQLLGVVIKAGQEHGRRANRVESENIRVDVGVVHSRVEMDVDLLLGLLGELNGFNLVHLLGVPGVRTEEQKYQNYPMETTPLGYRFTKHILESGRED